MIGDSVLGAEVRAGTFHFTWLSPTPTWQIVLGRWVGGSIVALITIAPACALAAVIAGAPSAAGPAYIAAAVGSVAYVALFIAIGCLTRRTAVWSLAIVFLVERLLGAALTGIAQLSPTWESRAIFVGYLDDPPDPADPRGHTARWRGDRAPDGGRARLPADRQLEDVAHAFVGRRGLIAPSGCVTAASRPCRAFANHRRAMQQAAASVVVVDREVEQAAVVPHGERSRCPLQPAGELGLRRMVEQVLQQRARLLFTHSVDPLCVHGIDEQRLAACHRMYANDRVTNHGSADGSFRAMRIERLTDAPACGPFVPCGHPVCTARSGSSSRCMPSDSAS